MLLAGLNLPNNEELAPDEPYDAGDEPAPEPVGYLSSPGAVVYIYYNQARLKRPGALDDIVNGYQQRHPNTDFQPMAISLEDLKSRRYFTFPRTEQEFIQRGYAAEFDLRQGPVGRGTSAYLNGQRSVLRVQAQVKAHALGNVGPAFFGWDDDFAEDGADEAERVAFMQRRVSSNLAPLTGRESVPVGLESTPFAMVDWEGLRLGRDTLGIGDHAHLSFNGTPESGLKHARDAIGNGHYGWHEAKKSCRANSSRIERRGPGCLLRAAHLEGSQLSALRWRGSGVAIPSLGQSPKAPVARGGRRRAALFEE